ncbi:hypothetical protein PG994_009945 [Apiospora phragmitis]|uniref:Uncharacterized protein n=1 Tax=Apiospora phragmitis TaxID=2905665 RepID=A0ABR1TQS1_9PEZI
MQSFTITAAFAAMVAMVSGQTFTAGQAITVAGQTVTLPTAITVSGFNLSTISVGNIAVPTVSLLSDFSFSFSFFNMTTIHSLMGV